MQPTLSYSNDNNADAGLFAWDLASDKLYADSALANLFGIDKADAERGLPLTRYVVRVHTEHRAALAYAIRQAIITGQPFQESYRVYKSNGEVVRILGFGRCFRDSCDEPRFYAGIVFPVPENQSSNDSVLWHCLSALEAAKREGRDDIAASLMDVITKLYKKDQSAILHVAA